MNKVERIKTKIEEIEVRIKRRSEHTHFGDPFFSEWYQIQVERIAILKEDLSEALIEDALKKVD